MARGQAEGDRLRRCRLIFERGFKDFVPMSVAKARFDAEAKAAQLDHIRALDARIAAAGGSRARPTQSEVPAARKYYWQEGDLA